MYKDISGIILSGGKSSRMGKNKSLMMINGESVISRLIRLMSNLFEKVIIISNEPELYNFQGIDVYPDIYSNVGPLAGIHSGLVNSLTEKNFIISCDLPLMNSRMITSIVNFHSESLITVPKADGFLQQLCGLYSKDVIPYIERIISIDLNQENRDSSQTKRKCKIHNLIESVPSTIIEDIEVLEGFQENIFFNMNKPEDFEYIIKL